MDELEQSQKQQPRTGNKRINDAVARQGDLLLFCFNVLFKIGGECDCLENMYESNPDYFLRYIPSDAQS